MKRSYRSGTVAGLEGYNGYNIQKELGKGAKAGGSRAMVAGRKVDTVGHTLLVSIQFRIGKRASGNCIWSD